MVQVNTVRHFMANDAENVPPVMDIYHTHAQSSNADSALQLCIAELLNVSCAAPLQKHGRFVALVKSQRGLNIIAAPSSRELKKGDINIRFL